MYVLWINSMFVKVFIIAIIGNVVMNKIENKTLGFIFIASEMFPCKKSRVALVMPQPGHGMFHIILVGHTITLPLCCELQNRSHKTVAT